MSFIFIILIGLALGFLSQFLTRRRDPGAFITRMIVGLISAIAGLVLVNVFDIPSSSASVLEIIVIIAFLTMYQFIFGKRDAP
jgi:uncharacterized membrane protein YeaQ/YmgE (transglycosylase-associated protein family)